MRGGEREGTRATWIALAVLGVLAWGSSGAAPFRDAARGAMAPSDLATDFVPAARLWRGEPPGVGTEEGNREAVQLGVPEYTAYGTPYRAHPPPSLMLVALLVPFGWGPARVIWIGVSLAAALVLAWACASVLVASDESRKRWVAAGLFVAIALWPPTLHDLEKGQWSLPIAGLLAGAFHLAERERVRGAAALVALAASFKIVPIAVLAALVSRERWRAVALGAGATLAFVTAASMLVVGPPAWLDFFEASPVNAEGWQTGLANTVSLWGLLARLLVGGPYAEPITTAPLVARALWLIAGLGGALLVVRSVDRASPLAFAAWSTLAALVNPLGWTHTATWLVVPAAIAASRSSARAPVLASLVLLTIPRQTLFTIAGPAPLAPAASLVLALHLVGAATLLATIVREARRR